MPLLPFCCMKKKGVRFRTPFLHVKSHPWTAIQPRISTKIFQIFLTSMYFVTPLSRSLCYPTNVI